MAPVEIVDPLPNYHIKFISPADRHKTSSKGIVIATIAISNPEFKQILLPQGQNTRKN
ncbi:hypothetical protein [Providencia stuartii]|uniref:hypothetical protein n=1 Tax=Providencia stuartii TaxID=588 RepID=UPI0018C84BCC|nr:hypothetical protein [Providencia stuartii]MBG5917784.1 hypothetical protein [Providencia stuartii]